MKNKKSMGKGCPSGKCLKNKKSTGKGCPLLDYLKVCGKTLEEVTRNWRQAIEYVDMARRLKVSQAWHQAHPRFDCATIRGYINQLMEAGELIARGLSDRRVGDLNAAWDLSLKELLAEPLILEYDGAMLPDYYDDYRIEPTKENLAEAEGLQACIQVPKIDGESILRLARAKDFEVVKNDKDLAKLDELIAQGDGIFDGVNELQCRSRMRLNEDKEREILLDTMAEFFTLCATEAKSLGDEALARQFVEAKVAAKYWKSEYNRPYFPHYLPLLSTTIWERVDELLRARAVVQLPTLAEAKKAWKMWQKALEDGR